MGPGGEARPQIQTTDLSGKSLLPLPPASFGDHSELGSFARIWPGRKWPLCLRVSGTKAVNLIFMCVETVPGQPQETDLKQGGITLR